MKDGVQWLSWAMESQPEPEPPLAEPEPEPQQDQSRHGRILLAHCLARRRRAALADTLAAWRALRQRRHICARAVSQAAGRRAIRGQSRTFSAWCAANPCPLLWDLVDANV